MNSYDSIPEMPEDLKVIDQILLNKDKRKEQRDMYIDRRMDPEYEECAAALCRYEDVPEEQDYPSIFRSLEILRRRGSLPADVSGFGRQDQTDQMP